MLYVNKITGKVVEKILENVVEKQTKKLYVIYKKDNSGLVAYDSVDFYREYRRV